MKLNILLKITSIYMAVVGLGLILVPREFGIGAVPSDASDALIVILRLWGSPLIGLAVMNWMVRNAGPSTARNATIVGNGIGFSIITVLDA